jgi:methylenetetrahydrofolate dehydrogenase (NADP+)/methenyltetrahydrofolate cyclohydrolase
MSSIIIDGRKIAAELLEQVQSVVSLLKDHYSIIPKLSVILVGDQEASKIYVRTKIRAASQIGILVDVIHFNNDCSKEVIISTIEKLNLDDRNHATIIQSPLPWGLSFQEIAQTVNPEKDVDGFHFSNIGKLHCNIIGGFIPCTALGCIGLLLSVYESLKGKYVVVVGRSNIVGRPLSSLLLNLDATVTVCHRATTDLAAIMHSGEIVISATGASQQFTKEYFAKGSTIIDVGITRVANRVVGDVNFEDLLNHASYITPVPGGVGPMTVATLMMNVVRSASIAVGSDLYRGLYDAFQLQ